MKSKLNKIITLLMLVVVTLTLTSCSSSKSTDASKDKYQLPLGECAYLADIDFVIYESGETTTDLIGNTNQVTVTFNAMADKSDYEGKALTLKTGYYEGTDFISYDENTTYYVLTTSEVSYTYNIELPTNAKDNDKLVLKFSFGTKVDEDYYISNNKDASKKDIKKNAVKKYRGSIFRTTTLSLNGNSLFEQYKSLDEESNLNNCMYYFNTATISSEDNYTEFKYSLNYKNNWWQSIIQFFGYILYQITTLVGGKYWIGLLLFTVLLRTVAWPIYAKTNSYTANMAKVQPELDRIKQKYEGKTDQNSMMKQRLETQKVMKENHVSMFGCFLPFLQMPIFLWVYQVVRRFPLTPIYAAIDYKFLSTSFGMTYGESESSWLLAIICGITMIGSQELTSFMQKRIQRKRANFYTAKNQQSNKSMRIYMLFMTVMMVAFAWNSAGMAFYWIIGNLYQAGQTFISKLIEEKKLDKELKESGRVRGR